MRRPQPLTWLVAGVVAVLVVALTLQFFDSAPLRSVAPQAPTPVAAVSEAPEEAAEVPAPAEAPVAAPAAEPAPAAAPAVEPRAPSRAARAPATPASTARAPRTRSAPEYSPPIADATYPPPVHLVPVSAPQPPPEPAPLAPTSSEGSATVRLSGDASQVWLVSSAGKRYSAGSVPEGSYNLRATFADGVEVAAGKVDIASGEDVTLKCTGGFHQCRKQ